MKLTKPVLAAKQNLGTLEGFTEAYQPTEKGGHGALTKILSNTIGFLTIVAGLAFTVYFLLGAISWITSSGQPEKVQKAQDKMTSAAIGLIAVVASYGIAFIVGKVLGIEILDPAKYILNFWS